jgi:Fe-S-cluster containining protein
MQQALRSGGTTDVPCGDCRACCESAQFVHIAPDEVDTLAHLPAALCAPAPGLPAGHVVLGYDAQGRCPMLVDGACSIYTHRPRACRTYDCRVFAAAGAEPEHTPLVVRRVRRWRFAVTSADDRLRRDAVTAAMAFLDAHPDLGPRERARRAVTALAIHDLFVEDGRLIAPPPDAVRAELARRRGER